MGTGLCILDTYIPKVCKGDYITVTLTSSILLFYFVMMLTLFLQSLFRPDRLQSESQIGIVSNPLYMDEDAAMDVSPYSTETDLDDKPINAVAFDFGQSKPE